MKAGPGRCGGVQGKGKWMVRDSKNVRRKVLKGTWEEKVGSGKLRMVAPVRCSREGEQSHFKSNKPGCPTHALNHLL